MSEQSFRKMGVRRTGGAPIYAQVADILADDIQGDSRRDDEAQLPSESALANEFKV